jgi:ribosomal peptide maturation radical SAM protein 1
MIMKRVVLINTPFASLRLPSIALTQLKAILDDRFKDRLTVEILYLNHDLAQYMGVQLYEEISASMQHLNTGLGDWFFRQLAFPELPDNTHQYFQRFYPLANDQAEAFKNTILEKRGKLNELLDDLITGQGIDRADLVGFTSMFSQNLAAFALARKLKERNPSIVAVMGGANCEWPMGQEIAKNVEQIDYVFSGPGLKSFPQFIEHWLDRDMEKCNRVKGLMSKAILSSRGTLVTLGESARTAIVGEELDINVTVKLDYDDFFDLIESKFPNRNFDPMVLFETSRGCWWGEKAHCTFCGLNGTSMDYRALNSDGAIEQFNSLFRYSSKTPEYQCVDNIMPKQYLKEVFPYLDSPANIIIFYEVKADLTEEDLQVLSKARVKRIQPGVEALATSTLKLMKKGTNSFQNISLLKNCALYDIRVVWNLLVGFPGEEEEVYRKYVRDVLLLTHLPPPSGVFPVRFDRYSPYFTKSKEYGLDLRPVDFYEMCYPYDKEILANLAYYFSNVNLTVPYLAPMLRWLNKMKEKVDFWKERWKNTGQDLHPQLFSRQDASLNVIYDSRSGEAIEYEISPAAMQVLGLLAKPMKLSDLASKLAHIPHLDPAKEVSSLQERGLLFEEGERYLSVVLPRASRTTGAE